MEGFGTDDYGNNDDDDNLYMIEVFCLWLSVCAVHMQGDCFHWYPPKSSKYRKDNLG